MVKVTSDLDERARENMGRLLLVLVGVLMLNVGLQLWEILPPGHLVGATIVVYTYGTTLALFILALVDVDLNRHGYKIALWCAWVIIASTAIIVWLKPGTNFGTDALLFSRFSVDLLLAGRNPFAESMAPAIEVYGGSILHVTPQIDGTAISSLSYPAGMVWAFVPQAALGIGDLNFGASLLIFSALVLIFLTLESPPSIALMPFIVMLGGRNLLWAAAGGLLDVVWLLPLLVSMHYWHQERYAAAAFAFGLAAGTKQTVWPIAGALAIWVWNDAETREMFVERASTTIGWGLAGFLVLNLPFMVWNIEAWANSVLTPISSGAPMVHQGVGTTLLTVAGVYGLPKDYYTLLTVASFVVALGVYALYWDRMKWVAWVLPPIVLFWYYRSLNSYFVWFLPVVYYAALCQFDLRARRWIALERLEVAIARLFIRVNAVADAVPEDSKIADAYEEGENR